MASGRSRLLQATTLVLILALAAALRLPGVDWGIPDATHPEYSYHPDETLPIGWARMLVQGQYIAKQFQYGGTLHFSILNAYHHLGQQLAPVLKGVNPLANTIFAGRLVVVMVSLATILLVWRIGILLFDSRTGLLAGLLLAVAPAHAFLAQNVRPDEISAFVATLLLLVSASIYRADPARDRRLFGWAGLAVGLAVALRFPLLLFGIGPVVARILREPGAGIRASARQLVDDRIGIMVLAAFAGYAVASPQTLLHPDVLMRGLHVTWLYEIGVFADAVDRGPGLYQYGWLMMREAFGMPLAMLVLVCVAVACYQRSRSQLLLLAFVLPYFVLTTQASWVVVRYLVPILPPLALLAAGTLMRSLPAGRQARAATVALAAAVSVWTILADAAFARVQAGLNVRDQVSRWLDAQVPAPCTALTVWQYESDVYLNPVVPERCQHYVLNTKQAGDTRALLERGFDRVILNESIYLNAERLGERHPTPAVYQLVQAIDGAGYELQAEFKAPVTMFGLDFAGGFRSQDYAMINPGIRVYRRAR
jgi:hypothetical protein